MSIIAISASGSAFAENGVTASEITFGQTAAFEGPASALGLGMKEGLLAAFKEVNDAGGVNGHKLVIKHLNDGYEPAKAIENTKSLINDDKVFALIGAVGTPTTKAIQPITSEAKVPLIGPFTGAGFLRSPYKRYVVNVRGTYAQEAETWVKHLTEDLGAKRIAILYQDDSFGRAGLSGFKAALKKRNMEMAGEGTYTRNTTAVKGAVVSIKKSKPDAIVTVGAYKPIAEFIRTAHKVGLDVPILSISFTGSKALAKDLGAEGEGAIITQVVPFPFDTSLGLVADYQKALKAFDASSEPGFVSLEGYMVGKLAAMALAKVEGELTRESFLDAFATVGAFDLGGVTLTYGANDNQGMDDVFLTSIKADGTFKALDTLK
ncbi:MAG: ABC transporter substrate-binding protein [Zetaproteobacteria bacterium]|nr:MAG: ABC transporter substrate-binding protein [Zetaproteobacteria bacterium]